MATGRPPKYSSPEEMQARIDAYFDDCAGETLRDDDGGIVLDKFGRPVVVGAHPPTTSGLARALGFSSRQSLLNYKARKQFLDTVTRAMLRLEEYTEERLYDRDGVQGARFSLTNNFKGWRDKPDAPEPSQPKNNLLDAIKGVAEGGMGDDLPELQQTSADDADVVEFHGA